MNPYADDQLIRLEQLKIGLRQNVGDHLINSLRIDQARDLKENQ